MTRTQLILEPWQLEALRSTAEREGASISSVVRRILTEALGGRLGIGKRSPAAAALPSISDLDGILRDRGFSARDHDLALYGHGVPAPDAPVPGAQGVVVARDRGATPYGARPTVKAPAPEPARAASPSSRSTTAPRARRAPATRKRS